MRYLFYGMVFMAAVIISHDLENIDQDLRGILQELPSIANAAAKGNK